MKGPEVYYLVCRNITDVFKAERILRHSGVVVRTVPSPPREAGPCTTVLEISSAQLDLSAGLLEAGGVSVAKIIPADNGRLEILQHLSGILTANAFYGALGKILEGSPPSLEDLKVLLGASGQEREALWKAADTVRSRNVGDTVEIRAALEFSNHCRKNCLYCGLRRDNIRLPRYRMTEGEIIDKAIEIGSLGIKTIILQSGEDSWFTTDRMINIIKGIQRETGLRITLSLGERNPAEYLLFKEAGASNYLLKVETTNPGLYRSLHPDDNLGIRMEHVRMIKEAGYVTGCGSIVGLPGQDEESIARDIIWYWQEGIHMIGTGPFVPAPGTPLQGCSPGSIDLTLNTLAVTRLVCRHSFIPSTTALASLDKDAQAKGLAAGANTVMLIMTPPGLREKYRIYGNKAIVDMNWALEMIKKSGRTPPNYLRGNRFRQ